MFFFFAQPEALLPARNDHPCWGAPRVSSRHKSERPQRPGGRFCVNRTQGLHGLLTSCIRLSVSPDGVSVTQPRCHGDQSYIVSLAPSWFVPVVKISSVSRKIRTTQKPSWCRFASDLITQAFQQSSFASFAVLLCGMLWFGCTLRIKWPPLARALARNIPRKETRKPTDKDKTNPARTAIFPARELYILQRQKVRLRDCRQGQLLLPRQGSAHCLSHVHSIAETLSQTTMITTITMSIRHPFGLAFFG